MNRRPFTSMDDLALRVPEIRKDELRILAEVGALNPLIQDHRRTALWEAERALRPAGPLLAGLERTAETGPLASMNVVERIQADYHGTGLTIGRHPMSLKRSALKARGIRTSADLASVPDGIRASSNQ